MLVYSAEYIAHQNAGIAREWAVCKHYHIERTAHDSLAYDKGSDLDADGKHISVKASAFTLMSGSLCEGRDTFESIWALYESRVHSDTFAYVTADFTVYEMSLAEFREFVFSFAHTERESEKNGGQLKIRLHRESKKMLAWLSAKAAA